MHSIFHLPRRRRRRLLLRITCTLQVLAMLQFSAAPVLAVAFEPEPDMRSAPPGAIDAAADGVSRFVTPEEKAAPLVWPSETMDAATQVEETEAGVMLRSEKNGVPGAGTLRIPLLVPDGKHTAQEWMVHVLQNGADVPGSPQRGDGAGTLYTLEAGSYTVRADGAAGSGSEPRGYSVSFSSGCPNGTVTVEAGAASSCALTATKTLVQLQVQQDVDTNADGLPDQTSVPGFYSVAGNAGQLPTSTSAYLPVGTYTVTGDVAAGYRGQSWVCTESENRNIEVARGTGATMTVPLLNLNADVTCTLLSALDTGTLTVRKNLDADGDGAVDQTNVSGWTWDIAGGAQDLAMGAGQVLPTGTYTISEDAQDGFTVADLTCNGVSLGAAASGNITLTAAGTECVFTNKKTPPPATPALTLDVTGPATVEAGGAVAYSIAWSVQNAAVTNAVLTDTLPTGVTFSAASCGSTSGSCSITTLGTTVTWQLGNRIAGESGTVTLSAMSPTPVANGTQLTNTVTFDADETVPVTDAIATTVTSSSTTTLQQTDTPDPVVAGNNLTYTLTWSVAGTAPVTNVTLTDTLPEETTFLAASESGTYAASTRTVTWALGTRQPGDTGTVTITVQVHSLGNGTTFTNTATLASAETAAVTASQTSTVLAPFLTAAKTASALFVNPGDTVTYTLSVTNSGSADATDVRLRDVLPPNFTLDGTTTNTVDRDLGTVAPGTTIVTTYLAKVADAAPAGVHANTAVFTAGNHPQVTAVATVEVRIPAVAAAETVERSVNLKKSVNRAAALPGDTLRYTLIVKNTGDVRLENVRLHDQLPKDFTFADTGSAARVWMIPFLLPGETRTIAYDVSVAADVKAGPHDNVVRLTADDVQERVAMATVDVTVPKVLGATTSLATTGSSPFTALPFLAGAALIVCGTLGLLMLRRRVHDSVPIRLTINLLS